MRILSLTASNIMSLVAVEIRPTSNVVQITGRNGSGKTAVLNCLWWALAGKPAATMPVRKGQEQATIRLDLGSIIVTRTFKQDETTRLTVQAADGAIYKTPQRMLDDLFGSLTLTFDPLAFAAMPAREQFEELRRVVPLDVDVDQLDRQNLRDYELRKGWNSKVASLKSRTRDLAASVDDAMDVTPVDEDALIARMEQAHTYNSAIEAERAARRERDRRIDDLNATAERRYADARELRRQADEYDAMGRTFAEQATELLDAKAADKPLVDPIDFAEVRTALDAARRENVRRQAQERDRRAHALAVEELASATAAAQQLTDAMDARVAAKQAAIARAPMPVAGLSFGQAEVLYRGVPFTQASTAEQIRVGFELVIARNPKLRVVRIQDGSLLDDHHMQVIAELAEQHDVQVWIERVSSQGDVGIQLEEGEVVSIDGAPVYTPDAPPAKRVDPTKLAPGKVQDAIIPARSTPTLERLRELDALESDELPF